jgi:hypothetical protein
MHWEFSFTPTEEEQLQTLRWAQQRQGGWRDWRARLWLLGVLGSIAGLALLDAAGFESIPAIRYALYGLLGALLWQGVCAVLLERPARRAALAADPALYLGPRRLWFDGNGLSLTWTVGELRFDWNAVTALESWGDLHVVRAGAHRVLVPGRVFQEEDERRAWLAFVRARLAAPPAVPRREFRETLGRFWSAFGAPLAADLRVGVRLALLRKVPADALRAAPETLLMLLVGWFALHGAADIAEAGPAGRFNAEGVAGLSFPLGLMVIAAVQAAVFGGRGERLLASLTALLSAALPIAAVALLVRQLAAQPPDAPEVLSAHLGYLFPCWFTLAAIVALSRLQLLGRRRILALAPLLAAVLALPLALVPRDEQLWIAPPAPVDFGAKYEALTAEEAFYQQPRLLERALQALKPQRGGATDLYFVGVGGDAEQSVFLKEVRAVEAMMAQRFGAAGRSIALINSYRSAMDYPVASVTALQQSLRRIGELMDRDDDILFLFLTSHGSSEHEFVLDFWPLRFKPLTPQVLKRMLDEAGIRWRVIVVSACYSGGYIGPLQDEQTVVISAAAADKSSFGCSDENDWTYFGRAFFQEALRDDGDLEQAFKSARRTIAQREEEEEIDAASDPQIAAAPKMLAKWRSFLAERDTPRSADGAAEDGYRRLLDKLEAASELPVFRSECRRQMDALAPLRTLEKQPGHFGGLTPKSPRWPDLVAAWERYAERYCHLADSSAFLDLYAQAWRDSVSAEALGRLDAWLAEPASRTFLDAQRQAERRFRRQLDDAHRPLADLALEQYQDTLRDLVAEFRQSRSARSDGEPAAADPQP